VRVNDFRVAREKMVREQLVGQGITDERVLEAMLRIPRHLFLDREAGPEAYAAHPFPIGFSQTMSQPYMVAYLAEQLNLQGEEKVLEIGTGSGYQAAILASLARSTYSIERIPELAERARGILRELRFHLVTIKVGDGSYGWPEKGPFDRILLTAAAVDVPQSLLEQLKEGGFLLGPVIGDTGKQEIIRLVRRGASFQVERLRACAFVPLVRERKAPDAGRRAADQGPI
jgi:protein-L-isoaspartate(D-aspartate) O-methyltransferase